MAGLSVLMTILHQIQVVTSAHGTQMNHTAVATMTMIFPQMISAASAVEDRLKVIAKITNLLQMQMETLAQASTIPTQMVVVTTIPMTLLQLISAALAEVVCLKTLKTLPTISMHQWSSSLENTRELVT